MTGGCAPFCVQALAFKLVRSVALKLRANFLLVTAAGFQTGRIGVAFKLRLWVAFKLPTPPRPDFPPYPKTVGGGVVV